MRLDAYSLHQTVTQMRPQKKESVKNDQLKWEKKPFER